MKISDGNTRYINQRAAAARLRHEKQQVENERRQFKTKLGKMKDKNDKDSLELEKDYQSQIDTEHITLKKQLNQVRSQNALALQAELDRAGEEIRSMKKSHAFQVEEIKESQDSDLKRIHDEHKDILYNARRKFEREYAKYQV